MSDKCPINLICTCYVGDDQNECQDMPCYACVLEGKENAETARDRLWEYLGKLEHYVLSHFEDETRTRKWIEANQPQMDVARDALAGGSDQEASCERCRELEEAIYGLLDGLDANQDERCGLSDEQWHIRIKDARNAVTGQSEQEKHCNWTWDEHHDFWDTDCGQGYYKMGDGTTPKDDVIRYCWFCGKPVRCEDAAQKVGTNA